MTIQQLLSEGKLSDAIAAQSAALRSRPVDVDGRWQLTVLLCFAGELDRAVAQLDALTKLDAQLGMGCMTYRALITAEAERIAVHRRDGKPLLQPDSPNHLELRLQALQHLRQGDSNAAREVLEQAEKERPSIQGRLNGESFDEIRDYDDLLAPLLEVYGGGHYLWLPLERVQKLELEPPKLLIDLLWRPARLVDSSGTEAHVHLPALYVGSHESSDEKIRLGRMTDWIDQAELLMRGRGQRTLSVTSQGESREFPFMELRSLEIDAQSAVAGGS